MAVILFLLIPMFSLPLLQAGCGAELTWVVADHVAGGAGEVAVRAGQQVRELMAGPCCRSVLSGRTIMV